SYSRFEQLQCQIRQKLHLGC
uniref:Uncharacterized protein n=1 Tax=Candida parapsilosis (strain CDC 317 / ATCC MYA-4646) TaxID=578454 RepID=A0AAJ8W1M5_CANPC